MLTIGLSALRRNGVVLVMLVGDHQRFAVFQPGGVRVGNSLDAEDDAQIELALQHQLHDLRLGCRGEVTDFDYL